MMTFMKQLLDEIERNQNLHQEYIKLGFPGIIGSAMIRVDIDNAKKSIAEDNLPEMLKNFEKLQNNK